MFIIPEKTAVAALLAAASSSWFTGKAEETAGVLLQERLDRVVKASGAKPPMPDYLRIAAADLVRDGLPDLADQASQQFYADVIATRANHSNHRNRPHLIACSCPRDLDRA